MRKIRMRVKVARDRDPDGYQPVTFWREDADLIEKDGVWHSVASGRDPKKSVPWEWQNIDVEPGTWTFATVTLTLAKQPAMSGPDPEDQG